ncbi:MAG: VIT1/CCC1 transporter family protein [Ilumatobacteraceae bacterium]
MTADRPFIEQIDPEVTDNAADATELRTRVDSVARGGARAAVLGANDGLVTNVCLILAVAGAGASASEVRVAGFASLIAGAFSMAAGEWVSVRSQVELYEGILAELRHLVRRNPKLILGELTAKLTEAGLADDTAQRAATELPLDETKFLDFTAQTVFGMNPNELGSPTTAAVSSLCLFSVGAAVPLAPWFIVDGGAAVAASVVATTIASMAVGGWISRSAGRPVLQGALRQLVIVIAAATVTYGIGTLFGTAIA